MIPKRKFVLNSGVSPFIRLHFLAVLLNCLASLLTVGSASAEVGSNYNFTSAHVSDSKGGGGGGGVNHGNKLNSWYQQQQQPYYYSSYPVASNSNSRQDISGLMVPEPFDGQPQTQYSQPQEQYAAPDEQYAAPEQQYGPPQQEYGPPKAQYGPPKAQYGPPKAQYGPPQQQYGPPQKAKYGYGKGQDLAGTYKYHVYPDSMDTTGKGDDKEKKGLAGLAGLLGLVGLSGLSPLILPLLPLLLLPLLLPILLPLLLVLLIPLLAFLPIPVVTIPVAGRAVGSDGSVLNPLLSSVSESARQFVDDVLEDNCIERISCEVVSRINARSDKSNKVKWAMKNFQEWLDGKVSDKLSSGLKSSKFFGKISHGVKEGISDTKRVEKKTSSSASQGCAKYKCNIMSPFKIFFSETNKQ